MSCRPMITLILVLVLVGCLLYWLNKRATIDANIKILINVVVVVAAVYYVMRAFGVLGHGDIPVPQLR